MQPSGARLLSTNTQKGDFDLELSSVGWQRFVILSHFLLTRAFLTISTALVSWSLFGGLIKLAKERCKVAHRDLLIADDRNESDPFWAKAR